MICQLCGKEADPNEPHALDGWQVAPEKVCAECVDKALEE